MIKLTVFGIGMVGILLVSTTSAQTTVRHQDKLEVNAATVTVAPAILVATQSWDALVLEAPEVDAPGTASPQPEIYGPALANHSFDQEAAASQAESKKLKFNVASYTGPLGDAGQLFAASKVDSEFGNKAIVTKLFEREQGSTELPPWEHRIYTWSAPHFYHQPLYFQQVNLERYGVGSPPLVSPIHSAAHFYGSMALWPAKMIWNWPTESVYSLGHQRPGDCVNYQRCTWSE